MKIRRFRLTDYIAPEESFHFARKSLPHRFPPYRHSHDFHEVLLVERGGVVHEIADQIQRLDAGDAVFIRPHDSHRLRADRDSGCRIINVMFRAETATHLAARYAEDFAGRAFDSPLPVPRVHRLTGSALSGVIAAADRLQADTRSLARVEMFLLQIAAEVAHPVVPSEEKGPRWFADACRATRQKEVFCRGAAGLIEAAGRSHEHVCRTCRDVLGLTPSAFVNQVRIDYAGRMLRSTDQSIRDVATGCGIDNLSHFYALFRSQMGKTPREYRLAYAGNPFAPDG